MNSKSIEHQCLLMQYRALLLRQQDERDALKRNHEEERHAWYRRNKAEYDSITEEERWNQ
jgi:hypothetical protein